MLGIGRLRRRAVVQRVAIGGARSLVVVHCRSSRTTTRFGNFPQVQVLSCLIGTPALHQTLLCTSTLIFDKDFNNEYFKSYINPDVCFGDWCSGRVRPDLRTALPMAAFALTGALAGAGLATVLPSSAIVPIVLVALVLVLVHTLRRPALGGAEP